MDPLAQQQTTPPEPATGTTPAPAQPETQQVPYDRFKEVNDRARQLEEDNRALAAWKAERESADLSETERLTRERDEALQRATRAEQTVTHLQHGALVRRAASTAGFADPDDAVAFLGADLDGIDSPEKAAEAVERLKAEKPHLIRSQAPQPVAQIGGLAGGQPQTEVPVGQDGQPDTKLGLGRDILASLSGR